MKVKVRGIEYSYTLHQENSDLPYLVLLHGFLGSGKSFESLLTRMSDYCNPITIDLLGHGETEGSEMHYRFSFREQSADLIKLISEQLQSPLFLHGYSMGGRLAKGIALQRPDLIQGLILESTTFGIENEQERQARQALDGRRADSIMGNYRQFVDEWAKLPLFESKLVSEDAIKHISNIQKNQNPTWMGNSLLGFGTGTMPCFKDQLDQLKMPIMLIAGEKDQKFCHIMQSMQKHLSNSIFHIIKGANHRVHLECPSEFVLKLHQFITSNTLP
ncbi:2-succinyl-6-hydroxy-2,4-cyclohexadiene-1-carboxylate synthase [Balneola vulgaris]|uniref:2-succinyl-6-hydroxy-2, 4-cyclohexadiene-1-carboxylate synthase n=1 Tax=Balneola vulgaris TaxID=287535 RepID=UPI000368C011|nr:2-succinyl-6-hydroxy-2,4-cyclohexadiene-1-carboxylate synthase [Balneola vulgaris]